MVQGLPCGRAPVYPERSPGAATAWKEAMTPDAARSALWDHVLTPPTWRGRPKGESKHGCASGKRKILPRKVMLGTFKEVSSSWQVSHCDASVCTRQYFERCFEYVCFSDLMARVNKLRKLLCISQVLFQSLHDGDLNPCLRA